MVHTLNESDLPAMLALMRASRAGETLGFEPTEADLRRHLWGDPDFEPALAAGLRRDGALRGFAVGVRRPWKAAREDAAFIKWLQLADDAAPAAGGALIAALTDGLRARGVTTLEYGASAPWYLVPGVPAEDAGLAGILRAAGWEARGERVSLVAELNSAPPEPPAPAGVKMEVAARASSAPVRAFIGAHFGESWARESEPALAGAGGAFCSVAIGDGEILGFAAMGAGNPNWFGPMGVRPDRRGRGLGAALLAHAVREARVRGTRRVLVSWMTGKEAFYKRVLSGARMLRFLKFTWRANEREQA